MQIKGYSLLETILILFIISSIGSIFNLYKPIINRRKEIISGIIHTQFLSIRDHDRYDFSHNLVNDTIWFNMSGNVNQANTIRINNSKSSFTIMLHTVRIHD